MSLITPETQAARAAPRKSAALLDRLALLHPRVIDLSLGRIQKLLDRLDNPERRLPGVIHVAGTNGKGSVVAFLKAIAEADGRRAHVYTSPHLVDFHERIAIAGPRASEPISEEALAHYLAEAETANAGEPITFFEITTAAALLAFADHPADLVLLETGLGGRLDATNVVDRPAVTAITPVSIDHVQFLGETLPEIAGEKAGIIKAGAPCIVARQRPEALAVIMARAEAVGSPLVLAGRDFDAVEVSGRLRFRSADASLDLPAPMLVGGHQFENAGVAIAVAHAALGPVSSESLAAGLVNVVWPARLQHLEPGPLHGIAGPGSDIWLDGGHNPAAGEVLAASLGRLGFGRGRTLHLVWGMMAQKDAAAFLAPFRVFDVRIYTVNIPGEPNAFDAASLAGIARDAGFEARPFKDVTAAIAEIGATEPAAQILIAGSLYFAGHVLKLLRADELAAELVPDAV